MSRKNRVAVGAILVLAATAALAQDEEGLSGAVGLGYLATSGNADNETLNLTFGGVYNMDRWHHSLDGYAVRASTSNITTAEARGLTWQTKYDLNETDYVFGLFGWNKDKFSGYDQQIREVVGYGRRIINREMHTLNAEAGLGLRQSDLRNGLSEDESVARLAIDYEWRISETAQFNQLFAVEAGSDNTYQESVTSLTADIMESFALVLSYTIKQNSRVPVGSQKKDTFTAVTLEYSF